MTDVGNDPYAYGERIERVVRHHARLRPDATAIQQGEATCSYGELITLSDKIAAGLRAEGVRPGDYVPVRMQRSVDFVAVLLAVLRAGGCYIALDPWWPEDRTKHVIDQSGATVVVHDGDAGRWTTADPGAVPDPAGDGRLPACVFYTSGSTGLPKGALSPHRGTIRALVNNRSIPLDFDTVFLQAAPLPWDGLSLELWAPLLNGGRCVLLDRGRRALDVDTLAAALDRGVNSLWLTSSLFNVFAEERAPLFRRLRLLLVGGERVSPAHVRRVLDISPSLHVVNGYGPVENTIFTTTHVVRRSDVASGADVPIGRPVPRTAVILLDEDGKQVPAGVVGELSAAGDGLALGYLAEPEETARRFFERDGQRFYRTGDLALEDEEGNLRYRGRVDRQLKVRGVRIEPSEVESVLERHPKVSSAHALRVPGAGAGNAQLGCVYTSTDGGEIDHGELREFVRANLIEPMRPTLLVHVAQLPLTANGKVDAAAAASILTRQPECQPGEETGPADPLLEDLRRLFALPHLRPDTDLLRAGMTSLDVIRLAARIGSHTRREVSVGDVYRLRTLDQILDVAPVRQPWSTPPTPDTQPSQSVTPLSHAQQRFWLAELSNPGFADNLIVLAYELVGALRVPALCAALNDIVRAHAILRTVYPEVDDLPMSQVLPPAEAKLDVELTSCADADGSSLQEIAEKVSQDWWKRPFQLDRELPVRARVCQIGEDGFLLCLQVHHIAFDGWSELVFIRQLKEHYLARIAGEHLHLDTRADYRAYARWERRQLEHWRATQMPFWRDRLRAMPPPFLPEPSGAADASRLELLHQVASTTVTRLTAAVARAGVPLAAAFIAGVARAVQRTFEVGDVCLGTVTNGRIDPVVEDLIGYLVNPFALPLSGLGGASAVDVLAEVGAQFIAALEHAHLPFDELVRLLGAPRGRHPWFQAWSVLQSAPPAGHLSSDVTLRAVRVRPPRTAIELMFEAIPEPDGSWLVVQLRRADGLDNATSARLLEEFAGALADFARHS